jgi:hypothetical protein
LLLSIFSQYKLALLVTLSLKYHLKIAANQAFTVKWHGILIWLATWISRDFFHALVTHFTRWPSNPSEHHRFIRLAFNRHRERGQLALWHIVDPTFHHF